MDRVRLPYPPFIRRLRALAWKLAAVLGIEQHELARHCGDVYLSRRTGRLEEPPPHDLERLVRRRGTPLIRDSSHHVLQPPQRLLTVASADLQVAAVAAVRP